MTTDCKLDFAGAVELCPCPLREADAAALKFAEFAPLQFSARECLPEAVRAGHVIAEKVFFNQRPAFVIFWGRGLDGGLSVNAVQSLYNDVPARAGFVALEKLRTRENAPFLRFASARKGLLRFARNFGFNFESVVMRTA